MKSLFNLIRPKHWLKNLLIFTPLFFSASSLNESKFIISIIGFLSFCLLSSSIYIFNDICDINNDKKHAIKKNRPIASGKIAIKTAYFLMFFLLFISTTINLVFFHYQPTAIIILCVYFLINILYSKWLKTYPIIDIVILATGFMLRILFGGIIVDISISKWLYLTTLSAALFIAFSKRRNEFIVYKQTSRQVLKKYNQDFLNNFMYVSLVMTLVFYSLWCIDPLTISRHGNDYVAFTIPLVWLILMVYCWQSDKEHCDDPVDLLTINKPLLGLILLYITSLIIIIYVI